MTNKMILVLIKNPQKIKSLNLTLFISFIFTLEEEMSDFNQSTILCFILNSLMVDKISQLKEKTLLLDEEYTGKWIGCIDMKKRLNDLKEEVAKICFCINPLFS